MNKLMIALSAMALTVPVMAFAQSSQSNDQQAQQQEQASQVNETGTSTMGVHHMTGMVSENGKRFTSNNTEYLVGNPHMLKKYDGQNVGVKFQFDTSTNQIHIMSVDQK